VVVLPLLAVIIITRLMSDRIKRTYSAARAAASAVSDQLGGLFSGVLSLKVAGAEPAAIARLREQNAVRKTLEVRARLLTDLLDEDETADEVVAHRPVYFTTPAPLAPPPPAIEAPFRGLEVEHLVAHHSGTDHGIDDVSFQIERGDLVAITGPVGSGKTTLVR